MLAFVKTLTLRARVLCVIVGLLLVAQLITMAAVLVALRTNAMEQARSDIDLGGRVFSEIFDSRTRALEESVGVLVKDFGFKSAVASGDDATIQLSLVNQSGRVNADLMLFQDLDGAFITADDHGYWTDDELNRLSRVRANSGEMSRAVIALQGTPYQVVAAPVFAPGQVGWIWAGFVMGDDLAHQMRSLTGMDVSFVSRADASVFASSLSETQRADIQQLDLADAIDTVQSTSFAHEDFLSRTLPLRGDGSVIAVLHVSLEEAMRPYQALKWQLLTVLIGTLALSLLLASKLSRSVTQPVKWLLSAAKRIGEGKYDRPIDTSRGDELGQLARTFNNMQRGIAQREADILHAASHDTLTNLPSRSIVDDRIGEAIKRATRGATEFCVLMMDLNRFKEINDTLGHQIGDQVLVAVADRLRKVVRECDTAARLGGDEFLIILEDCKAHQARETVHRMQTVLAAPLQIDEVQINVSLSMGIAAFPEDASDAESLLRRADIAMYSAKEAQVSLALYRAGQDEEHLHKLGLIADLCHAVQNNLLHLQYQPKVDTLDNQVRQVEALVRWNHPQHGRIMPDDFISLAEESGNIGILTDWVLNESVRQVREWLDEGLDVNVAINLSALDLLDVQLPIRIKQVLATHDVSISSLNLEITESAVMHDAKRACATLDGLRAMGATISIDDFGTGHSSLAQLKRLPVQVLKIDKSFVMNMADNADDEVIVRSTIELAHNMGLKVVAEGVDNDRSRDLLISYGCEFLQGYLYSKPLDAESFKAWLTNHQAQRVA